MPESLAAGNRACIFAVVKQVQAVGAAGSILGGTPEGCVVTIVLKAIAEPTGSGQRRKAESISTVTIVIPAYLRLKQFACS